MLKAIVAVVGMLAVGLLVWRALQRQEENSDGATKRRSDEGGEN